MIPSLKKNKLKSVHSCCHFKLITSWKKLGILSVVQLQVPGIDKDDLGAVAVCDMRWREEAVGPLSSALLASRLQCTERIAD